MKDKTYLVISNGAKKSRSGSFNYTSRKECEDRKEKLRERALREKKQQ